MKRSGVRTKALLAGAAGLVTVAVTPLMTLTPVAADEPASVLVLSVSRAAMAETTIMCGDAPCSEVPGQNVPSGQTDGKRLLVGRESADDAGSERGLVLLSEFDVTAVPSGVGVARATLRYQLSAGAPSDLEIRSVSGQWTGSPFANLPALGGASGLTSVVDDELVADVTSIVRAGLGAGSSVDVAMVPTTVSGFGQVFSPTANPAIRRPVLELEFVTDDVPPSITLTAPAPGPAFGDVVVSADASDNVGVDRVELYVDGVLASTDTESPWVFDVGALTLPDGPHFFTVRAVDGVGLAAQDGVGVALRNEWSTSQRLDYDIERGALSVDEYATYAVDYVLGAVELPARYSTVERSHSLSGWFVGVLALWPELTPPVRETLDVRLGFGSSAAPSDSPSTLGLVTAAADDPACAGVVVTFPLIDYADVIDLACRVSYAGFTITYPAVAVGGFSVDDLDGNGIPDEVDERAAAISDSSAYFASVLGFEPAGHTDVVIVPFLDSGLSIPNLPLPGVGNVYIGAESGTKYLPSHEIFHQFQYRYFSPTDFSWVFNPFGGRNPVAELDSIRWYMEASAEWASHKWLTSEGSTIQTYANEIDVFLGEPHDDLARNEWTNINGPQYGAFVVPEYLEARGGVSLVREVWEEVDQGSDLFKSPHVYASMDRALTSRGFGGLGANTLDMWRTLYELAFPEAVATSATVQTWRDEFLEERLSTTAEEPVVVSDQNRMARLSDRRTDGAAGDPAILLSDGDVATIGDIRLGSYAGAVAEIKPDEPGILYLDLDLGDNTAVDVRALDAYGGSQCATPTSVSSGDRLEVTVPFPEGCHYVAVVFANESDGDQTSSLDARFGDQPDKTIENGTIRLGVNNEGHLNVPGFDPSSGTGTSTVGLRLISTNADALAPGCECEGWGIGERFLGFSGWANNSWGGTDNLAVDAAVFGDDTATSRVRLADAEATVSVEHHYRPVPNVPYLYAIDVTVRNITAVNSDNPNLYYGPVSPVYRRVMDWDVEPTAFSEYVTIAAPGGVAPPEIAFTSNDGFGSPDPLDPYSDLGATGLFDDFGPDDQGAMIQIDLGTLYPSLSPTVTFTMFYGAAPDEATAIDALTTAGAELYSLAQPDVIGGASTGEPNTFMWGYRAGEGGYEPPAVAASAASTVVDTAPVGSSPGVARQ
jgi:hypothetical protein